MGLLRFGLPPQASQLRPPLNLSPESLIQVDRGFASSDPVLPGEQEYAFAYRFPYVAPVYAFSLALPYGAASVRVLVPAGPGWALDVAGPDLAPLGEVDVGPRRYRVWGGGQVPPGGRLQVELRNLPPRPLWRAALTSAPGPRCWRGPLPCCWPWPWGRPCGSSAQASAPPWGSPRGSLPGPRGPLPPRTCCAAWPTLTTSTRRGVSRREPTASGGDLVMTRALEATPPGAGEVDRERRGAVVNGEGWAVEVEGLWREFGAAPALRGVRLRVAWGERVALLGPNGAGKTTLLKVLATLLRPTSGWARVGGWDTVAAAGEVRRRLGFVGHQTLLYPDLTVEENLRFYAALNGAPPSGVEPLPAGLRAVGPAEGAGGGPLPGAAAARRRRQGPRPRSPAAAAGRA